MQHRWICSVAVSFHVLVHWFATCCICSSLRGFLTSPTSHMQIIFGFMLCTTLTIAMARRCMLAASVRYILLDFQSMLMNIKLADISVLCRSNHLVVKSTAQITLPEANKLCGTETNDISWAVRVQAGDCPVVGCLSSSRAGYPMRYFMGNHMGISHETFHGMFRRVSHWISHGCTTEYLMRYLLGYPIYKSSTRLLDKHPMQYIHQIFVDSHWFLLIYDEICVQLMFLMTAGFKFKKISKKAEVKIQHGART